MDGKRVKRNVRVVYNNTEQATNNNMGYRPQHNNNNNNTSSSNNNNNINNKHPRGHNEIELLRQGLEKLILEVEAIKERIRALETQNVAVSFLESKGRQQQPLSTVDQNKPTADGKSRQRKKFSNRRRGERQSESEPATAIAQTGQQDQTDQTASGKVAGSEGAASAPTVSTQANEQQTRPAHGEDRYRRRRVNNRRHSRNEDSTTQEPEGEDTGPIRDGERKRVHRKKRFNKHQTARRNYRHRVDSSERNSNDTSPQDDVNGDGKAPTKGHGAKLLSSAQIDDLVTEAKSDFIQPSPSGNKKSLKEVTLYGPQVFFKFCVSILDHVFCDAQGPAVVKDLAERMYDSFLSQRNYMFTDMFANAINDVTEREKDITLDAPRYLETLGQFLALIVAKYYDDNDKSKSQDNCRRFLEKCLSQCTAANRANLLVNIFKSLSEIRDESFSVRVWSSARLSWENYIPEGTDVNEFIESNEVQFLKTNLVAAMEDLEIDDQANRVAAKKNFSIEVERFADDVTKFIECREEPKVVIDALEERKANGSPSDCVEFEGAMIYAVLRGCVHLKGDQMKLDAESLKRYVNLLQYPKENQEVAMSALKYLTVLWHSWNSPKDVLTTMFQSLHAAKAVSPLTLKRWLESDDFHTVPGIGAARLNTKRYIEELNAAAAAAPLTDVAAS